MVPITTPWGSNKGYISDKVIRKNSYIGIFDHRIKELIHGFHPNFSIFYPYNVIKLNEDK